MGSPAGRRAGQGRKSVRLVENKCLGNRGPLIRRAPRGRRLPRTRRGTSHGSARATGREIEYAPELFGVAAGGVGVAAVVLAVVLAATANAIAGEVASW